MVAEQFGEAIEMEAITRAAKYGRMTGETLERGVSWCFIVDFQALVTAWSAPSWMDSSGLSPTTWKASRSCWGTSSALSPHPLGSEKANSEQLQLSSIKLSVPRTSKAQ